MRKRVWAYIGALLAFLVLDGLWLGLLMSSTYKELFGPLMLASPNWGPAAVFYLLYVVGVVFFVVRPALAQGSARRAAVTGAFFGLIAYGTYDMTNLATLKGWPPVVTIVDMAWGMVLTAATATAGFYAASLLD